MSSEPAFDLLLSATCNEPDDVECCAGCGDTDALSEEHVFCDACDCCTAPPSFCEHIRAANEADMAHDFDVADAMGGWL